jgi:hypothetical protein
LFVGIGLFAGFGKGFSGCLCEGFSEGVFLGFCGGFCEGACGSSIVVELFDNLFVMILLRIVFIFGNVHLLFA